MDINDVVKQLRLICIIFLPLRTFSVPVHFQIIFMIETSIYIFHFWWSYFDESIKWRNVECQYTKFIILHKGWEIMGSANFGAIWIKHGREKRKESCHCLFLHNEQEVLLFAVRFIFLLFSLKITSSSF